MPDTPAILGRSTTTGVSTHDADPNPGPARKAVEPGDSVPPAARRGGTQPRGSVAAYCMFFFNEEHWCKAKWRGMFYELPADDVPRVGLFFEDRDAGTSVFREWRDRFGAVDQFDELRISFVFGSVPGQPQGYSVVLSPDLPGVVNRYISSGMRPRPHMQRSLFMEHVRYRRMLTDRRRGWVPEVERFRRAYNPGAPFLFGPAHESAVLSAAGSPQVLFDTSHAIRKHLCYFQDVAALRHDRDVEACVLSQSTDEATNE